MFNQVTVPEPLVDNNLLFPPLSTLLVSTAELAILGVVTFASAILVTVTALLMIFASLTEISANFTVVTDPF